MLLLRILSISLFISISSCLKMAIKDNDGIKFYKKTNFKIEKTSMGFECDMPDKSPERNTSFSGIFCKSKPFACFNYTYENGDCWADWKDLQNAFSNEDALLDDKSKCKDIETLDNVIDILGLIIMLILVK